MVNYCGVGGVGRPPKQLPGDPDNSYTLSAIPIFGGIRLTWTFPETQPEGVSFFELLRSSNIDGTDAFTVAMTAGGTYDDLVGDRTYFYWVRWVSYQGSIGEYIGPVTATGLSRRDQIVSDLADQISSSMLVPALRNEMARIDYNRLAITQEILDRAAEDDALAASIETMSAALGNAEAAIQEEALARITEDQALAAAVTTIGVRAESKTKFIYSPTPPEEGTFDASDVWVNTDDRNTQHRWNGASWEAINESFDLTAAIVQDIGRTLIGYCSIDGSVGNQESPEACSAAGGTWVARAPFAESVKAVQVTDSQGNIGTVEQVMQALGDELESLGSLYTLRVGSGDLIGGFGIGNDGQTVDAIFDVDRFGVGKLNPDGTAAVHYPLLIDGNQIRFNGVVSFTNVEDGPPADATRNVYRGFWSSDLAIQQGDIFLDRGNGWIAKVDHNSTTSNRPPENPESFSSTWGIYTVKGDPGADGVDGINGSSIDMVFRRESSQPATPSRSTGIPNGWYASLAAVPHSTDPVWSSVGYKGGSANRWDWEVPIKIEGRDGPQGVPGKDGKDGEVYYTWIRYADDASGNGISNNPTGKEYIGFSYNQASPTESNKPSDYMWSLIKGADGVKGADGEDGQTTYTWIAYSDYSDGTSMYQTPNSNTQYIGIATNKTTATESTDKTDYTWSRFRGYDGADGENGLPGQGQVKGVAFRRSSASSLAAPSGGSFASPNPTTSGWSDGVPAGTDPLWMSTRMFTSDGQAPQQSGWTTPQMVASLGKDGTEVKAQFSINGTSGWTDTPAPFHEFMRMCRAPAGTTDWVCDTTAVKIKGETGEDATVRWMMLDASAVKRDSNNAYQPGSINVRTFMQTGSGAVEPYPCRVRFQSSTNNGSTWSNRALSASNSTEHSWNISGTTLTHIRVILYFNNSTGTPIDERIIPVVLDGAKGDPGTPGSDGNASMIVYRASTGTPTIPTSSTGVPSGWSTTVPSFGIVWESTGNKPASGNSYFWSSPRVSADYWRKPGVVAIDGNKIFAGDAYVDTLQIKGNAVTVPETTVRSNVINLTSAWTTVISKSITNTSPDPMNVLITCSGRNGTWAPNPDDPGTSFAKWNYFLGPDEHGTGAGEEGDIPTSRLFDSGYIYSDLLVCSATYEVPSGATRTFYLRAKNIKGNSGITWATMTLTGIKR